MIIVERNPVRGTKYPWRARYGDRILIAETSDEVLQMAWAVWGGNIAALVNNDEPPACNHGVTFNEDAAGGLGPKAVRKRWPRLYGACPLGCGFSGIAYASMAHFVFGDW